MYYQIKSYLKFWRRSKNQYAVHSPFVFDLLTKCVYDRSDFPEYAKLGDYRKRLLGSGQVVEVTDFGAGSRVFRSDRRKVSDIAKHAGISEKRAELLFRLTRYFEPGNILEIGTSLGLATSALSLGNPRARILTLEGCPETAGVAMHQLGKSGFDNIEVKTGEFASSLGLEEIRGSRFGLVYFDGNHQKDATLRYFDLLLPTAANDSVWIFDDIHWSPDMESAWETIKKNPAVTVTVDTFRWGLAFFRKEQRKEHFTLRI
jgi:predicted O-methyltransferase YrrM